MVMLVGGVWWWREKREERWGLEDRRDRLRGEVERRVEERKGREVGKVLRF